MKASRELLSNVRETGPGSTPKKPRSRDVRHRAGRPSTVPLHRTTQRALEAGQMRWLWAQGGRTMQQIADTMSLPYARVYNVLRPGGHYPDAALVPWPSTPPETAQ